MAATTMDNNIGDSKPKSGGVTNVTGGHILCPGHSRKITDIQFSQNTPDGFFLITGCQDYKAMIREGASGDWMGTFDGHKGAVWSARLNGAATRAATSSGDFTAKLWDALTGDELHTFTASKPVKTSIFNRDGTSLYTGGHEKLVKVYDLNNYDAPPEIWTDAKGHQTTILDAVIPSDDALVVTCADEKDLRLWDRRTAKVVKTLSTNDNIVKRMEISADGSMISAAAGKEVFFWDSKTMELVHTHKLPRDVACVAYNPRARAFIVGCVSEIYAHDIVSGKELASFRAHHGPVECLAFSPLGDAFASGATDATLRLWNFSSDIGTATSSITSTSSSSASSSSSSTAPEAKKV